MSSLQKFQFRTKDVRTVLIDGEVLFVGRDVATVLGYADATNAIKQHCRGVAFHHPISDRFGRSQQARVMNEADLMRLVIDSKLPAAEWFERWVFEEVLPTIRDIYTVQTASNLLEDGGLPMGRGTLFRWLRAHGWVGKNDRSPLQKAITAGYVKRKYYEDGYKRQRRLRLRDSRRFTSRCWRNVRQTAGTCLWRLLQ